MIIGFAGRKQVGKSTAAGFLVAAGFVRTSFAEPMKQMVQPLLLGMGLSFDQIRYYEAHKEEPMPIIDVSMRHLLQTLGTDWGRKLIDSNIWVKAASRRIKDLTNEGLNVVIEDVRFENEAALIRGLGGRILHIESDTGYQDSHESEAGIKFGHGDVLINNCNMGGGLDLFRMTVLALAGVNFPASPINE